MFISIHLIEIAAILWLMSSLQARMTGGTIRTVRKLFYNTPVQHWKITAMIYNKVFSLGAPDFTKPVPFRGTEVLADSEDRSYLPGLVGGYYEKLELNIFEQLATASKTFLDIGANIGIYSLLGARKNKALHCYAFEPVEENYRLLEKNVAMNDVEGSIEVVKKAVSDKDGTATIYLSDTHSGTHSLTIHRKGSTRQIDTITVDTFCADNGIRPDLIKIDVEGHEPSVFAGMTTTIDSYEPTIMMEFLAGVKEDMDNLMHKVARKYRHCYVVDDRTETITKVKLSELELNKNYNLILSRLSEHKRIVESFIR